MNNLKCQLRGGKGAGRMPASTVASLSFLTETDRKDRKGPVQIPSPPPISNIPCIRLTIMYIFTSLSKFGWIYAYYSHQIMLAWNLYRSKAKMRGSLYTSVVDPHHVDTDPDADSDSTSPWCGSGFRFYLFDADPDADPDPQHCSIHQQKPVDDVYWRALYCTNKINCYTHQQV